MCRLDYWSGHGRTNRTVCYGPESLDPGLKVKASKGKHVLITTKELPFTVTRYRPFCTLKRPLHGTL